MEWCCGKGALSQLPSNLVYIDDHVRVVCVHVCLPVGSYRCGNAWGACVNLYILYVAIPDDGMNQESDDEDKEDPDKRISCECTFIF